MIRGKHGRIMFCFQVDTPEPVLLDEIKRELRRVYNEEKGKFKPPLEIMDLGKLSESIDPFTDIPDYVLGACIVSTEEANGEWFEDLLKKAIKRIAKEENRAYHIFTWDGKYLDIFIGKRRPFQYEE